MSALYGLCSEQSEYIIIAHLNSAGVVIYPLYYNLFYFLLQENVRRALYQRYLHSSPPWYEGLVMFDQYKSCLEHKRRRIMYNRPQTSPPKMVRIDLKPQTHRLDSLENGSQGKKRPVSRRPTMKRSQSEPIRCSYPSAINIMRIN